MEQRVSGGAKTSHPGISTKNQEFHPGAESAAVYREPETYREPARHFPVFGNPDPREIFAAQAPPV